MTRPKGSRNRRTLAGEQFAALILDDPEVIAVYQQKARRGELSDVEFRHLCDLRFGKPTEHIAVSRHDDAEDLRELSYEELASRAEQIAMGVRLMEVVETQFEAEVARAEARMAQRELAAATNKATADGE